jgi:hypothetical protein
MHDISVPAEFMSILTSALEHHTDGIDYNGHCVGLTKWDGDALLVPIVTSEQFAAGEMYIENAKKVFRISLAVVK